MHMKEERHIPAPRDRVWHALNDSEVLKASMPGCERFEKTGDDRFEALISAKVGPVESKFKFDVSLSESDPPRGYVISGEAQGGDAGFATGAARVALAEDRGSTVLSYDVEARVGGKLGQLGGRVIDGAAKQMADEFFDNFIATVAGDLADSEAAAELAPEPEPEPETQGMIGWVYAAAGLLLLIVLYAYFA